MSVIMFFYLKAKYHVNIHFPDVMRPIPHLAISSAIIGGTLTNFFAHVRLNNIDKLIDSINELADGNFKVRINFSTPIYFEKLSDSFNRMAEELENTEILRSDFINNFSHEFKTPIVSLRGFAKLLKTDNLTDSERNEYLDIIINEADRLSQLATNVLNLSKIENLSIVTDNEPFNLTEQIRRIILLLEPKWSKKELELIIDMDEVTFTGNAALLDQVWINLIDNAVKFSKHGSKIKIKLQSMENCISFKVLDNGYGIEESVIPHIFDRFYQSDASHVTEGNGIGLAIVQKIILLYNGTIEVKSEVGIGSTFTVIIPYN